MTKNPRATSSEVPSIKVSTGWRAYSGKALARLYKIIVAASTPAALHCLALLDLNGYTILRQEKESYIVQKGMTRFIIPREVLNYAATRFSWLDTPPDFPLTLDKYAGHKVTDPELDGLKFGDWLAAENFYLGYLVNNDPALLDNVATILIGAKKGLSLTDWERVGIMFWFQGLKSQIIRQYPDLYPQKQEEEQVSLAKMIMDAREVTNSMLRALSRGNVEKEQAILDVEMHRALTELNYLAKESKELKSKQSQI